MKINVKDVITVSIPDEYQKLNAMPEDPKDSVAYGKQTSSADCFVLMFPINSESSMPFNNEKEIIDGIHNSLADDQGLIEVKTGLTQLNNKFVYSIVKTKLNPSGVQYTLIMNIDFGIEVLNVQAYFSELGMTGQRDSAVLNKLISEGVIMPPDMSKWRKDPYDINYSKGLLMNLSESREYDNAFSNHPLSEIRKLINNIINN
jgi:hypothetical protein